MSNSKVDIINEVERGNDDRRVKIIDFNHLAHKFSFGMAKRLSAMLNINNIPQNVDTTIPTYTIKQIAQWSNMGYHPTVVCFDSPIKSRKFAMLQQFEKEGFIENEYKGERIKRDGSFYESLKLTYSLLNQGGVGVLKAENYEADDLVFAAITRAKEQFPGMPIDVITNDWDLAPLCDDQVSVYIRSNKMTYATTGPELNKYVQVTPESYQTLAQDITAFKTAKGSFYVPYNSILLWKLLRGDKSDNIPGLTKTNGKGLEYTPTKMRELLELIEEDYELDDIFRYGKTPSKIIRQDTGVEVTRQEIITQNIDKGILKMQYGLPVELEKMVSVLAHYIEDRDIRHVINRYQLMNLNGAFVDYPQEFKRQPIVIKNDLAGFEEERLQQALNPLSINLKTVRY